MNLKAIELVGLFPILKILKHERPKDVLKYGMKTKTYNFVSNKSSSFVFPFT